MNDEIGETNECEVCEASMTEFEARISISKHDMIMCEDCEKDKKL